MKTFRTFGPTLGKSKLSKKIIGIINNQTDKITITKKMTIALNLLAKLNMK